MMQRIIPPCQDSGGTRFLKYKQSSPSFLTKETHDVMGYHTADKL